MNRSKFLKLLGLSVVTAVVAPAVVAPKVLAEVKPEHGVNVAKVIKDMHPTCFPTDVFVPGFKYEDWGKFKYHLPTRCLHRKLCYEMWDLKKLFREGNDVAFKERENQIPLICRNHFYSKNGNIYCNIMECQTGGVIPQIAKQSKFKWDEHLPEYLKQCREEYVSVLKQPNK